MPGRRPRRSDTLKVTFLFAAIILTACQDQPYRWHGNPHENPPLAPDFELPDPKGDSLRLRSKNGSPVLLFFGYTQCPDACPATVGTIRWVFRKLDDPANHVTFAFVSINPDHDTPEILARYLGKFDERFIGLSGDKMTLVAIKRAYGVFAEVDLTSDPDHHLLNHTSRLFLIDADGILRTNYTLGTPPEDILADVDHILHEIENP